MSKESPESDICKPPPENILEFPEPQDADRGALARWINLADQALGNNKGLRKKA